MKRLALNFICKNESGIIHEMLASALPITDLIVAVDTGSTDNTISLIQAFGQTNNIPTYVFQRPFDDFCNSRNHALARLKEVVHGLGWEPASTWGFFIDCDEILDFAGPFSKGDMTEDLYLVGITDMESFYSRQFLFRLSKDLFWEGPIHEMLSTEDPTVTVGWLGNPRVIFRPLGASWKGDIEQKYLSFAQRLIAYVNEGHRSFRWLFHIGGSYSNAANACKSPEMKQQWLLESRKYYAQAAVCEPKAQGEAYVVYDKIAEVSLQLNTEWSEVRETLLQAYSTDSRHAEPLLAIIRSYTKQGHWETGYLFSQFAVSNYNGRLPMGEGVSDVRVSVYQWELLFYHILVCMNSGRVGESKGFYEKLKSIVDGRLVRFNGKELLLIRMLFLQYKFVRAFSKKTHDHSGR